MAKFRVFRLVGGRRDGEYVRVLDGDFPDEWKVPETSRRPAVWGEHEFPNLNDPVRVPAMTYRNSGAVKRYMHPYCFEVLHVPLYVLMPPHGTGMALLSGLEKARLLGDDDRSF